MGITRERMPATASPRPGTKPMTPSMPKRKRVKGMRKASSRRISMPRSVSSRKSHAPLCHRSVAMIVPWMGPGREGLRRAELAWGSGINGLDARSSSLSGSMLQSEGYGGYSSAAERLTVAQDVVGSIPTSRPNHRLEIPTPVSSESSQIDNLDYAAILLKAGLRPFEPRRGLRNAHLQTILGNYMRRPAFQGETVAEPVLVDPSDGSRVMCHCDWQPEAERAQRLTVILVHGLEGSSESRYIRGIATRSWKQGCNVVRMNMRNCGNTDELTPTLYHSGLSNDVGAVMRHYARRFGLERVALVGYSMGGNLVLKLAGEWGSEPPLRAVATVCPA